MTDNDIPTLLTPDQMPPIRDQASLLHTWRALMGELGFASVQLWLLFTDADGRALNHLRIDSMPAHPDTAEVDGLRHFLGQLLDDLPRGTKVALLCARPGRGPRSADDLAWATALHQVCQSPGIGGWPVHLANDDAITVFTPDDLAAAG